MKTKIFLLAGSCFFIMSFKRYMPYLKKTVEQAKKYDGKVSVKGLVRSKVVRCELAWLTSFDALWLNDKTIKAYAQAYAYNRSNPEGLQKRIERQEQDKVASQAAFYVLTPWMDKKMRIARKDSDPGWTPSLSVDGVGYAAHSIKEVDLPSAYRDVFGDSYTRYKNVYKVIFNVGNASLKRAKDVSLVFVSGKYSTELSWK